jgi:hypothetical protein
MSNRRCFQKDAIHILGLSYQKFKNLGLNPVEIIQNPNCSSKMAYHYDLDEIERLVDDPKVIALRRRQRYPKTLDEQLAAIRNRSEQQRKEIEAIKQKRDEDNGIDWI